MRSALRLTPRGARALAPPLPPETSEADRIALLNDELRLLSPYASTKGLPKLKARVNEIKLAIHRLHGLPLEPSDG